MVSLSLVAFLFLFTGGLKAQEEWEYTGVSHGPSHWKYYVPTCGGYHQSPVDLIASAVTSFDPFTFSNWNVANDLILTNNGHTVTVSVPKDMKTAGGGLNGAYIPVSFHFHWGVNSDVGSEHQIDGHRFPMELHIVHHSTAYEDSNQAIASDYDREALAVVACLFEISEEDNREFEAIIQHLKDVVDIDDTATLSDFSLDELLPSEVRNGPFFRYYGSLTTPPCSEVVAWTVFSNKIPISERQMEEFRKLHGAHSDIIENWRPHQDLHDRVILASDYSIAPRVPGDDDIFCANFDGWVPEQTV